MVQNCITHHAKAFSGGFIVRFSESEFSQDCSGHHFVRGHVWEKVYFLSYGSKSYSPIIVHAFCECSIFLDNCLLGMIHVLPPFMLVCWNLCRHAQKFLSFKHPESCVTDFKFYLAGKYGKANKLIIWWTSCWALCDFMLSWTVLILTLMMKTNYKNKLSFKW